MPINYEIPEMEEFPDGRTKDQFDLVPIRDRFLEYETKTEAMVQAAERHKIDDPGSLTRAVEMGIIAKRLGSQIDDQRKLLVEKPNNFVKSVNNFAKTYLDKLKFIEANLKSKISQYQANVELQRRKIEEVARKETEKLQARLNMEAKEAGVSPVEIPAPIIPKTETITRTEVGSSYQKKQWTAVVINPDLVPLEYREVSQKLIDDAVRRGIREIPGVEIKEISVPVFRS